MMTMRRATSRAAAVYHLFGNLVGLLSLFLWGNIRRSTSDEVEGEGWGTWVRELVMVESGWGVWVAISNKALPSSAKFSQLYSSLL
jgi:hypothetical protein